MLRRPYANTLETINTMQVSRLIYRSVSTAELVSNETLRDLERQSSIANAKHDITGLLVLSGNVFLQVLEGASRDITELFGKIIRDERHQLVELITFENAMERYFADWNMRLVDLYDLPGDKRSLMASKYASDNGGIVLPNVVHAVYALLLDVKNLCDSTPWRTSQSRVFGSR